MCVTSITWPTEFLISEWVGVLNPPSTQRQVHWKLFVPDPVSGVWLCRPASAAHAPLGVACGCTQDPAVERHSTGRGRRAGFTWPCPLNGRQDLDNTRGSPGPRAPPTLGGRSKPPHWDWFWTGTRLRSHTTDPFRTVRNKTWITPLARQGPEHPPYWAGDPSRPIGIGSGLARGLRSHTTASVSDGEKGVTGRSCGSRPPRPHGGRHAVA